MSQICICLTVIFEIAHSDPVPCCSLKSCFLNSSTVNCKIHFASGSLFFNLRNYFHCSTKLISKSYYLSVVQQNYNLYSWREVPTTIVLKILRKERSIMETSHSFKNVHFECHRVKSLIIAQKCLSICGKASDSNVTLVLLSMLSPIKSPF